MKSVTPHDSRFKKKWAPWLGSTSMPGSVDSTIAAAPEICPQLTGIPSQGSELPHLPNVRRIVIDRPNCGLSGTPARTTELVYRSLRDLVPDVLDALDLERAHVVGSSLGGTIALYGALAAPERIDRIVLLGAPTAIEGLPLPATERLLLLPGMARLAARFVPGRGGQRKAFEGIGHAATIADGRIPDIYWDWNDRLLHDTGSWRDELASYGAFASWSMRYGPGATITQADLGRVASPTHIVWGAHESYGGRGAAELLAGAMPQATITFMPNAGHLPWLDDAAAVGAITEGFLLRPDPELSAAA